MRAGKKRMTAAVALAMVIFVFAGCGSSVNKDAVLVDINKGEETISLGYANFVARYTQALYDANYGSYFGKDMWSQDMYGNGNTFEEDTKESVLSQIQEEYLLKEHAEEYGVSLSKEDEEAIDKAAKAFMDDNSNEAIKTMGASEEYVRMMLTYETYAMRVMEAVKDQAQVTVSREEAAQRTFTYAFFDTQSQYDENGTSVAVTEDDRAKLYEHALVVSNAADFEASAQEFGATVTSYSYGADESSMDAAVIAAADSLAEGQVSGVISVDGKGYYVIRLDSAYDEEATDKEVEQREEQQRTEYFQGIMDEWKEAISWEVDEESWKTVSFETIFSVENKDSE